MGRCAMCMAQADVVAFKTPVPSPSLTPRRALRQPRSMNLLRLLQRYLTRPLHRRPLHRSPPSIPIPGAIAEAAVAVETSIRVGYRRVMLSPIDVDHQLEGQNPIQPSKTNTLGAFAKETSSSSPTAAAIPVLHNSASAASAESELTPATLAKVAGVGEPLIIVRDYGFTPTLGSTDGGLLSRNGTSCAGWTVHSRGAPPSLIATLGGGSKRQGRRKRRGMSMAGAIMIRLWVHLDLGHSIGSSRVF